MAMQFVHYHHQALAQYGHCSPPSHPIPNHQTAKNRNDPLSSKIKTFSLQSQVKYFSLNLVLSLLKSTTEKLQTELVQLTGSLQNESPLFATW
jgi:hypothetical protein